MSTKSLWLMIGLLLLQGCAHSVHLVHTSDFSPYASVEQGQVVTARAEQFVILGITNQTRYVNQAYEALLSSCPEGLITGITTQLSTSLGFFSWTNKALIQGLCVKTAQSLAK